MRDFVSSIDLSDRKTQVIAAAGATGLIAGAYLLNRSRRNRKPVKGPLTPETLPKDAYDAVIVGAGA